MNLFEKLTTRELAILIWIVFIVIGTLFIKGVAEHAKEIVKLFFQKGILTSIGVILVFSGCCVYILFRAGFWEMTFFKDTLIWFITVPLLTMVNIRKISEDAKYFGNAIKELFAFSAIADFLVSSYSFSLPVELLLTFFVICFTLLSTSAKNTTDNSPAHKIFKNILFLIGLFMAFYSLIQIIAHFKQFASWETLNTFLPTQNTNSHSDCCPG